MKAIYEAEAGRLLALTERVLLGKLTLDLAMRFRSAVNRSVVYDRLSAHDRHRVNLAMAMIRQRYMMTTVPTRVAVSCRYLERADRLNN